MTLTLYIDMLSQPSRAILLFCLENRIPHKVQLVQIGKLQHKSPEFLKLSNGQGQLPLIDDNGFVLIESGAILRYLATSRNTPDHWYPKDAAAAARVNMLLDWHHTNLRPGAAPLVFAKVMAPKMGMSEQKQQAMAKQAEPILKRSLTYLNNHLIKANTAFLCGPEPSIADLSLACETAQLELMAYDLSPWPEFAAWMSRVKALPRYPEVAVVLNKMSARYQKDTATATAAAAPAAAAASSSSSSTASPRMLRANL